MWLAMIIGILTEQVNINIVLVLDFDLNNEIKILNIMVSIDGVH